MIGDGDPERDLAALVVPQVGPAGGHGDRYEPYRLLDPDGAVVEAAAAYFRDLLAAGRAESTVRSYGLDPAALVPVLLGGSGVAWDRATRAEARDFCRWLQVAGKQSRPHWRTTLGAGPVAAAACGRRRTRRRCVRIRETVLRSLLRLSPGRGHRAGHQPVPAGPVPPRRAGARAPQSDGAVPRERSGLYRPRVPEPDPAQCPRRGVQRDLRPAALAPGPGAGRLLRLHRGAGVGAAVGHAGWGGSGAAADHGGPEGNP